MQLPKGAHIQLTRSLTATQWQLLNYHSLAIATARDPTKRSKCRDSNRRRTNCRARALPLRHRRPTLCWC